MSPHGLPADAMRRRSIHTSFLSFWLLSFFVMLALALPLYTHNCKLPPAVAPSAFLPAFDGNYVHAVCPFACIGTLSFSGGDSFICSVIDGHLFLRR
ncbi:hypothetical protein BD309DRAFT_952970 [Dichomitus squalens]|nr:hypothetical protein BD309DRAFT_952970 [Dichomitus squalens]